MARFTLTGKPVKGRYSKQDLKRDAKNVGRAAKAAVRGKAKKLVRKVTGRKKK